MFKYMDSIDYTYSLNNLLVRGRSNWAGISSCYLIDTL